MNKFLFRIKLLFIPKKDRDFATYLYNTLGFAPKNIDLYRLCFIHRSSSYVYKYGSNERLEFLGDAILDGIVADYLYMKFPNAKEGNLTQMRSTIVNRKNLNNIGIDLRLQKYILARIPNLKKNDAIGNCLEALIGTIYKDRGYRKAKEFVVNRIIYQHTNIQTLPDDNTNYKSTLLQYCQKKKLLLEYQTEQVENQENKKPIFKSQILINDAVVSQATGPSKKSAEQAAAKIALKKYSV
ncbi:MAG: ribonuclease III [Bacteroidales bacterium]|nr:ribonuclease III [Bacteroidales bacterium]